MTGKQLKNAILQLAIQGKLVPQDVNDEPASVLLAQIRKEKEQLVKAGKLKKKDLATTPITDEEKPFEIPESWEWVRLGEYSEIITGSTPSKLHPEYYGKEYPFYKPSELDQGINVCNSTDGLSKLGYESTRKTPAGSVLVTCIGATIGKTGLITKDGSCNQQINAILPSEIWISKLLFYFCNSAYFQNLMRVNAAATTLPIMNKSSFSEKIIPLPPLAEQHRIVSKIEELMPLVEEYGAAQEKLNSLNEALPEALKKSILQQAIQGKLVPQDANDEPASVLLARIRKEKEQLVKAGKLKKKDLETTPIADEEKPFEIPESWEWVRLGEIGIFERGNGIKRDETFSSGRPCVRYGEMYTKYRYNPTFDKTFSYTSQAVFDKCRKAHNGDLFMALTGENKQDIALAAQYVGNEEIAVGGDLCHFSILQAYALFFVYVINSQFFSDKKELLATGDIIVHISADKLGSIPIPLPPLAEQKRIVAKIEELMAMVDGMERE